MSCDARDTQGRRDADEAAANEVQPAPRSEKHDGGPNNVELFLDGQGPEMAEVQPSVVWPGMTPCIPEI